MYINRLQLQTRRRTGRTLRCLSLAVLVLLPALSNAQIEEIDTTEVRETKPVEKSFGDHLLRLPVYLLQSPVWVLENTTHFLVDDAYGGVVRPVLNRLMTTEYRVWGAYPTVGYNSNAGVKFGALFQSRSVFSEGERLKIRAYYSTNEYQAYRLQYYAPNLLSGHRGITFRAEYNKKTRESFYGLGQLSAESDEVNYAKEETFVDGGALWVLAQRLTLSVTGGYRATNIFDGDDQDEVHKIDSIQSLLQLPAAEFRATRLLTASATLTNDDRDSEGRTTRGGFRSATAEYYHGVGRTDGVNFWRVGIDLRQYLELFRYRVIAVRLAAQQVDVTDGHSIVPFYLKSGLGGYETLRAYRTHRLVDNDFILAQLEYRWPVLDLVDAFLFFDEGHVFSDMYEEFNFRDWKYSTGGGLRVVGTDNITATLMLAAGAEGPRYYLEFSGTF